MAMVRTAIGEKMRQGKSTLQAWGVPRAQNASVSMLPDHSPAAINDAAMAADPLWRASGFETDVSRSSP